MKRREEIRNILEDILSQRIVILDGAMGTMIQSYGLSENDFRGKLFSDHKINLKGNNDLLSITKPEIIREIHHAYLEAGADIIKTNTINANGISQSEYGLSHLAYEINRQSALIAVEETKKMSSLDKPRFVAGVIGPTSKMLSVSPDVNEPTKRAITFDELVDIYLDAIKGLFDGGVDLFLIETIFDTLNCKAAIFALYKFFDAIGYSLPIMLSATLADTSGRMLAGQTAVAFACSVLHAKPLSIGLNCAFGPRVMYPLSLIHI
ncbi:MAG: homocysteine S-methyltransferase family protein, partial [Chitinispirillaceae bacterium]|nr:homocysteine S-methyltransferase family protein [Chitinispirillaceae bacterium]